MPNPSKPAREPSDIRISQLEEQVEQMGHQMKRLLQENRKLKQDLRFFEVMLIEQYHMLLHMLGKDQNKCLIQSVAPYPKI
ncbi:hypothetical protein [Laceyella putida]|uniref:Uncharacterized protein n=1 Tax=Laceyella putida TaxID=110101 RepID=A0ABW2RJX9_9BACL